MTDIDKNILKALKGIKPTDFTKAQPIDSKTAKVMAKLEQMAKELGKGKPIKKELGGPITGSGSSISEADRKYIKRMLGRGDSASVKKMIAQKEGRGMSESDIKRMNEMLSRVKPKKMNMGGVMTGRGGRFKGTR
jgi:hypothetical protein